MVLAAYSTVQIGAVLDTTIHVQWFPLSEENNQPCCPLRFP